MYAVAFQVDMKEDWDGDPVQDLENLVEFAKTLPGFIRGTWTFPDARRRCLSFLLFETEENARSVADAPTPPDGPVTLHSADVYEVARHV